MGDAHIGHGVAAHKAIAANKSELARQHLIAAGAIVRVQQDDFIGFRAVDLAGVAQAQHVFRVLALAFIAHAGLRHHERLKPFFAKLGQNRRRRDIGVSLRTTFMRGIRKDGRRYTVNLVIGQRVVAAQSGGIGSETGCKHVVLLTWLLKKAHTGFLDSEPSLSAVRCGRHEEPGWPRCHRLS
ncbi:hypothetical protein G6F57_015889 [Rhizopus arrhizus]|nr:hypothetical protein G6F57_015889 [Rhizopus arrhizus]